MKVLPHLCLPVLDGQARAAPAQAVRERGSGGLLGIVGLAPLNQQSQILMAYDEWDNSVPPTDLCQQTLCLGRYSARSNTRDGGLAPFSAPLS